MVKIKKVAAILKIVLLGITLPIVHQAQEPKGDNESAFKVNTDLVVVDAQILRKKGMRTITGLEKKNFILSEGGIIQEITHFNHNSLPLSIILLVDISGSVSPTTDDVHSASVQALGYLKNEDQVALMVFNSAAWLVQDFTTDKASILRHLRYGEDGRIDVMPEPGWSVDTPMDGTRIADSIFQAAKHFRENGSPAGRRAIIVITDNLVDARVARYSHREVVNELLESGASVYGLIVDNPFLLNALGKMGKYTKSMGIGLFNRNNRNVNPYASETGGLVLDGRKHNTIKRFSEIIDMLRHRYSLGYVPTNTNMDGKFRKIRLKVVPEVEEREGDVIILAKQGYYARPRTTDKFPAAKKKVDQKRQ